MHGNSSFPAFERAFKKPMTQAQIAKAAKLSPASVSRNMMRLRGEGLAHISGWAPHPERPGACSAIYSPGPGVDVPCDVRPMSQAERSRRYHERQLSMKAQVVKRSANDHYAIPRQHPLVAMLFWGQA